MDEIFGYIALSVLAFLVVTLGGHFLFALAWAVAAGIGLAVVVFIWLGVWISDFN